MKAATPGKTFFGHPQGLFLLFSTELWERFSYYAMRAILVLYLVDKVRSEGGYGLGWQQDEALRLYATFTGLFYLTPLLGGWLADNFLGQRKAIYIGGALMAAGQFALGMPHNWLPGNETILFYAGLTGLVLGNGLFKPNISTMVGDLYQDGDHRRDSAFTIFYMGINLGAFLSAIVVGSVVRYFDGNYQAGFVCAGAGMLISLLLQYLFAHQLLGDIGTIPSARLDKLKQGKQDSEGKTPLTQQERDRIKVILIMGIFTAIFWAGFEQAGGLFNLLRITMHGDRLITFMPIIQ
jgi:POT family proton-dependent oligopeptide transporter